MKKLLLIDAYSVIYRAYYAFIKFPRINSKGMNTSAIFGFVNTLLDVLKREAPTHVAVAFDPPGKTFRHQAYEQYKAQREATPEDIRTSVPVIKEIVSACGIPVVEVSGYEADDVIGTLARRAEQAGFEVLMLTSDKDYGQLVSERVFIYRPRHSGGYERMGAEEVKAKFALDSQEQVIDLLGLMGDATDNIPGCPGVGEKTAVKLLKEFGSIDGLLSHTELLKGALKKKVEDNKEQIVFSRFLATIKTDVPLSFDEEQLRLGAGDEAELHRLFEELEFRSLLDKVSGRRGSSDNESKDSSGRPTGTDGQMALFDFVDTPAVTTYDDERSGETTLQSLADTPHTYHLVDTPEKREALLAQLAGQHAVCFDTETTGVDVFNADMVGISFCWKAGEAHYVPLPTRREEAVAVLAGFAPFFADSRVEKIGQNMKFDLLMLGNYGIHVEGKLFDTMIAHYLLQPELRHGMDYLAEVYLKYRTIHYEDLVGPKGKKQQDIRTVSPAALCDYAAEDADVTFRLKAVLEQELASNGLERLFYEVEMPLMRVLAVMERNGVRIDKEALRQSSDALTAVILQLEREIREMAGVDFNLSSARQVGDVLFNHLKIDEKAKKTKTGQYATTEEVLEKLRQRHPIVGKILEYRGLKKLLGTYIDALPQLVNPHTGKIHTSYNQTVTATGRLSSSNPNLQNIPIRDSQGKEIRRAFIPDEGEVFLSADYSQIELRIMAHLSGDPHLLEAFNSGHDIHSATAAKIYNVPIDEVTPEMRRKAKTANFGIIYGISTFGLADRLSIPRAEAKKLIDGYFSTYPGVKAYMDRAISEAKEKGYVETLLGRKRYLPDINSRNSVVRGYAERNAINAPIQGTAADIIKIAMVRIQDRFEREGVRAKMIMQVHDELNFTVPQAEATQVRSIVVEEMERAFQLRVPLVTDCGMGANWLEAH